MESILVYNLRTRFFPDIQFLQNHIANNEASFKAQKVVLPSLKCQVLCFWSKFVSFTQLSRKQVQFSKIWLFNFLLFMAKYPHPKLEKIHWVYPDKNASQTEGYTDRWTDWWADEQEWFYRTPSVNMEVWLCSSKIREYNFLKLFDLIVSHIKRINTRKRNTINTAQCSKSLKTMILSKVNLLTTNVPII